MMTKIRSIQDSWLAKGILILTALSFMSLFGVSGYLSDAGKNRPIIKVDDIVIYQDDITNQYNQELQTAKNMFGDSLEITDAMRNSIMMGIVQKDLINAIMQKTADELNVSVSDELVRKIIYSQAEFMDAEGKFSIEKLRRLLNASGWSEQRYIDTLRQDVVKQHLIQTPVENINVPKFMNPYLAQLENQKKVFEYVSIKPTELKIDRKISAEELEQYYQDFAAQFEEPEKRDVSFIELSTDKLAAAIQPDDEEIQTYYNENISQFVIPENRSVLQMMFETQEEADKAYAALNTGADFYKTAADLAKQDKASTELGEVSKEMLIADMSDAVFALKAGEFTQPIKSELGWHVMKVTKITPKKETSVATAKAKIVEALRKEKAYDQASETIADIEDKLGAGASLDEIAKQYGVKIYQVQGLAEDGTAAKVPAGFKSLVKSNDFVDTAFSYNANEISQVLEGDDGFTLVRVDKIQDAHPLELSQVKGKIEQMWAANEKNAIAQEIVNDVTHDLESGDKLKDVAQRFGLQFKATSPLKRSESFAGLNGNQMSELFQESLGTPKQFSDETETLIIVPVKVVQAAATPSKEEMDVLRSKAAADLSQAAANQLIDAYGSNYRVRIKYKYLNLTDENEVQ